MEENAAMIWIIKIECEWGIYLEEECSRTIEVYDTTTLYDLHLIIQKVMKFGNDHLFEFFAGRNYRNRKLLLVDVEDTWDCDFEASMQDYGKIQLCELYPLPKGLKLFYHFDFGDDWYFKIAKSRKKPRVPEQGVKYPRVIEENGPLPQQYPTWDE